MRRTILTHRNYYKPFDYEWAYKAYETQQAIHWLPKEVPLAEDVNDWSFKLTEGEKSLLTQIFRFFTQADIDVASGYIDKYMPTIKPPELRMMMSSFAAMEAVHIDAYSLLIETIGMPETEYKAFQDYQEMSDKHEYMWSERRKTGDEVADLMLDLAIFSAFSEGLQLFSSFAILMNFQRFGKMKGMGQIVSWSIRDESLHVDSMLRVFKTLCEEYPDKWNESMEAKIYLIVRDMVELEDRFINLAFKEAGSIEGLTKEEVKEYVRYTADRRLIQLGLNPEFGVEQNPLDWLEWTINGVEHANFFENRATEYTKGALTGDWSEARW